MGSYRCFEAAVEARKLAEVNLHDNFLREFAVTQTRSANG